MAREEKPPQTGYAATLMDDENNPNANSNSNLMKGMLAVMVAAPLALQATRDLTLGMGNAMSLNQSMKAPSMPTMKSPLTGGPKIFG